MQITQFHIDHFKPTYLYLKQHSITGKLYFGKTTQKNVERYTGSGIHWGRHISLHGKDKVVTLWYCLFTDIQTLYDTALKMSEIMDIVVSEDFLNFKPETGLDGGSVSGFNGWAGKKHSAEHLEKMSNLFSGVPRSDLVKEKMALSWTDERKAAHLEKMSNPDRQKIQKEVAKRMGELNAKPKELKTYSCCSCKNIFTRLEYSHHSESKSPYCSRGCAMKEAISVRANQKLSCLHCKKIFDVSGFVGSKRS